MLPRGAAVSSPDEAMDAREYHLKGKGKDTPAGSVASSPASVPPHSKPTTGMAVSLATSFSSWNRQPTNGDLSSVSSVAGSTLGPQRLSAISLASVHGIDIFDMPIPELFRQEPETEETNCKDTPAVFSLPPVDVSCPPGYVPSMSPRPPSPGAPGLPTTVHHPANSSSGTTLPEICQPPSHWDFVSMDRGNYEPISFQELNRVRMDRGNYQPVAFHDLGNLNVCLLDHEIEARNNRTGMQQGRCPLTPRDSGGKGLAQWNTDKAPGSTATQDMFDQLFQPQQVDSGLMENVIPAESIRPMSVDPIEAHEERCSYPTVTPTVNPVRVLHFDTTVCKPPRVPEMPKALQYNMQGDPGPLGIRPHLGAAIASVSHPLTARSGRASSSMMQPRHLCEGLGSAIRPATQLAPINCPNPPEERLDSHPRFSLVQEDIRGGLEKVALQEVPFLSAVPSDLSHGPGGWRDTQPGMQARIAAKSKAIRRLGAR